MRRRDFIRALAGVTTAVATGAVTALFAAEPRQVRDAEHVEEMVDFQVVGIGHNWLDGIRAKTVLRCRVIELDDAGTGFTTVPYSECTVELDWLINIELGDHIRLSKSLARPVTLLDTLLIVRHLHQGRAIRQLARP